MGKRKYKIAMRTCAGCFCKFDRRKIIQELSDAFADQCSFEFSYKIKEDGKYDAALLISGCDSECAEQSDIVREIIKKEEQDVHQKFQA